MMETHVERRKYVRFISRSDVFIALLTLTKLGSIKDISQDSLSFEFYSDFAQKEAFNFGPDDSITGDIFIRDNRLHVRNIHCRVVYDIIAPEDRPAYSVSVTKGRCGLKFDSLTEEQEKQIKHFLENHTVVTA